MLKLAPLAMTSDASATGWRVMWFVTWCSRGFARSADRRKRDSASPGGADPTWRGKTPFIETGGALCYTPSLRTGLPQSQRSPQRKSTCPPTFRAMMLA